jgi:LysM repeat protein
MGTAVIAALLPMPGLAAPALQGPNLLTNPGFEQPYIDGNKQATGWGRWFQVEKCEGDKPDDYQYWCAPDFAPELNSLLVTEGSVSQHVGRRSDPWRGGVKQPVTVAAGSQVRFCAFGRIFAENGNFEQVPSWNGHNGRLQVGVFPNGDADWNTPGIVWSGEANPHNAWEQICVDTTVGSAGKVTVFTSANFRGTAAFHLDVWWDNASLVALGVQPTATTAPGATAPAQAPTSAPVPITCETRADGTVVYTVQAGDTLGAIAFACDTTVEEIQRLNNLTSTLISIGQVLIIRGSAAPTSAPTSAPTAAAPEATTPAEGETPAAPEATPTVAPTEPPPASTEGEICVEAFNDSNTNQAKDGGEQLLGGVGFTLSDSVGALSTYVTSGLEPEAYCFGGLAAGTYLVEVRAPVGVNATTDQRWELGLRGGETYNVQFGGVRGGSAPVVDTGAPTDTPSEDSPSADAPADDGGGLPIGRILLGVIGIIVLLAAGFIANLVIGRARAR